MLIIPVLFSQRVKDRYYHNTTSYMAGVVKKLLMSIDENGNPKPVELIMPNDDEAVAQMSLRRYNMTENSKIRLESKDTMKKRGLPSPDVADCILLLCLPLKKESKKNKIEET